MLKDSHIVVVDDDPSSLHLMEKALAGDGYRRTSLLSDPRRVKDLFAAEVPDLVVLDMHMPHFNGLDLLERLTRLVPAGSFVPFLMLTADVSDETRRRALKYGAADFLTKPIDVIELRLRVARLLETRRLTVELDFERAMLASMVADQTEELRKANQDLQRLVVAKDEFVASVSHELRTPLTAVVGFARELAEDPGRFSEAERVEMIATIASQSADVGAIIDDLLVAARADIGGIKLLTETVDLLAEIHAVTRTISVDPERIHIIDGPAFALGDRLRIRQVLRNLLVNAVRYGGPVVSIHVNSDDNGAEVIVSDNGPGIPLEYRESLFDPYFHGDNATTQPASIGLGLTVSRQLARLMGGDLVYHDVKQGSSFRLLLPGLSAG